MKKYCVMWLFLIYSCSMPQYIYVQEDTPLRVNPGAEVRAGDTLVKVGFNKYYNISAEKRILNNFKKNGYRRIK